MRSSILTMIHIDRFFDLSLIADDSSISMELLSMGDDQTVEVRINGDIDVVWALGKSIQRIRHILSAPVVLEVAE